VAEDEVLGDSALPGDRAGGRTRIAALGEPVLSRREDDPADLLGAAPGTAIACPPARSISPTTASAAAVSG